VTKLSDLSGIVQEALCAWQLFRQLGYSAEQIYAGVDCNGKIYLQAQWRGKTFTYGVGNTTMSLKEFATVWDSAADTMRDASEAELDEMWYSSKVLAVAPAVLTTMADKGIYWPNHEDFKGLN